MNSMMGGTSKEDALKAMKWNYAADGVKLVLKADESLNRYDNLPHTLLLQVVQLAEPNTFLTLTSTSTALSQILTATTPPTGVLALQPLFVDPGEAKTVTLPRVEGAQYIGVVAGYYNLAPTGCARLYRIGVEISSKGMVVQNRTATPELLQINLQLGADGLLGGEQSTLLPSTPTQPKAGEVPLSKSK